MKANDEINIEIEMINSDERNLSIRTMMVTYADKACEAEAEGFTLGMPNIEIINAKKYGDPTTLKWTAKVHERQSS